MTDRDPIEGKPGSPWMRIVLFTSLALNLLVLGAVVGSRFGEKEQLRKERVEVPGIGNAIGPYGRALSKEDRRALGREFVRNARELRSTRQEMRALGAQVVDALRAEPFDATPVRALLGQQIEVGQQLQRKGQSLLVERIEAMTPAARAEFADNLEKMLKRGPRKPHREN